MMNKPIQIHKEVKDKLDEILKDLKEKNNTELSYSQIIYILCMIYDKVKDKLTGEITIPVFKSKYKNVKIKFNKE